MKKRIALLLAAAMLLTMTACGGTTEPTPTTTAETTESVATAGFETTPETSEETAYIGIAEEVLQNGNAVTESYSDLLEYEMLNCISALITANPKASPTMTRLFVSSFLIMMTTIIRKTNG